MANNTIAAESRAPLFFLRNSCHELRRALNIQQLMLPHRSSSTVDDISIYWDDREDGPDSHGHAPGIGSDHQDQETVDESSWRQQSSTSASTHPTKYRPHHQRQPSEASMGTEKARSKPFKTIKDTDASQNGSHYEDECNEAIKHVSIPSIQGINSPLREGCAAASSATTTISSSKKTGKPTKQAVRTSSSEAAIHANVLRVVGCPMLEECGTLCAGEEEHGDLYSDAHDRQTQTASNGARYAILMRHPGDSSINSLTRLTSTGGIKRSCPFIISHVSSNDDNKERGMALVHEKSHPSNRSTVLVELVDCTTHERMATGTIQTAEIFRISRQGKSPPASTSSEFSPYSAAATAAAGGGNGGIPGGSSSGFFRRIMGHSRRKQEREQSIAWVRLVDDRGAEAGHVLLTAGVTSQSLSSSFESLGSLPVNEIFEGGGHGIKNKGILGQGASSFLPITREASTQSLPDGDGKTSLRRLHASFDTSQSLDPKKPLLHKSHVPIDLNQQYFSPAKGTAFPPSSTFVQKGRRDIMRASNGNTSGGYFHANPQHVYDVLLEACLVAAGCNASSLAISGPWKWLLDAFAEAYGVHQQYATLSYLCWVVRKDIAAPTATCLGILSASLMPIINIRDKMGLASSELALLGHVLERCKELVTVCFENYFALSEDAQGGLSDGALSVRQSSHCPPALAPGVALAVLLCGQGQGAESVEKWLSQCIHRAARKRFQALLAATESQHVIPSDKFLSAAVHATGTSRNAPSANASYAIIEELCTCITSELTTDASIQASNVFQNVLPLPSITSVEYIRGIMVQLHKTLQIFPPPGPTPAAVRLVEAVGSLQCFIERHQYTTAASRLNSKDVFGKFVQEWVESTMASLLRALRTLDRAGPMLLQSWLDLQGGPFKHRVSPLIEDMLSKIEAEMQRYQRIVNHWPSHALQLEQALVFILRHAASAVSRQCGLVQTKEEGIPASMLANTQTAFLSPQQQEDAKQVATNGDVGHKLTGGRVAWRWIQVGALSSAQDVPSALRRGMNPHQALLLNSLRRMLAVVPQLEHTLVSWCGDAETPASDIPSAALVPTDLGAHWAQLVKELRTEYFACITLCAESLTNELSTSPNTSVIGILRREGLIASPDVVSKRVRKVLAHGAATLRWLGACLDGRVFIALGRGLWDLAARDILRYAEDLNEGGGLSSAWRGRKNAGTALKILDGFFKAELAAVMGSDLFDRDLVPPQHAQRAAALLADNSLEINASFEVY